MKVAGQILQDKILADEAQNFRLHIEQPPGKPMTRRTSSFSALLNFSGCSPANDFSLKFLK